MILSADEVRLGAALELGVHLHAALAAGHGEAEALRRARVALAADERYADPFDWALTYAFGYSR